MPDQKGNLYVHEAVALRNEYDSHVNMLKKLLADQNDKSGGFISRKDDEIKQPVEDFSHAEFEDTLKKVQTKRLKLNHEIQGSNFAVKFNFEGSSISITEALEIRKSIKSDIEALYSKAVDSAYNTIIHKEGRDIIDKPRHSFMKIYTEYLDTLKKLRRLEGGIHNANHNNTVNFKDE